MANNITLIINGTDFSDYIQQQTDIKESMRKVYGTAQGEAVDGSTIADLVAIKWDPSFLLKPMPQSKIITLINIMEQETVSLVYTSIKTGEGITRPITAMPQTMSVQFATKFGGERIYAETPISFQEV